MAPPTTCSPYPTSRIRKTTSREDSASGSHHDHGFGIRRSLPWTPARELRTCSSFSADCAWTSFGTELFWKIRKLPLLLPNFAWWSVFSADQTESLRDAN